MSKITLSGNPSGTGTFTIASPDSNSDRTVNLPDAGGDMVLTTATQALTNKTFSGAQTFGTASLAEPTGTAPLFMCRAWVNFNGTGTVAIRASGNVSSITDNGTGDYTVNFTTAMPDVNYSAIATTAYQTTGNGQTYSPIINTLSVSSARIYQRDITSGQPAIDNQSMYVALFR